MKRFLTVAALIITSLHLHAQVGIGNTDPKAILDVTASNIATPLNTDGLLVPRVSAFPVTNPGADQNGMLLYLTTTVGINTPGFYYWNQGSTNWQKLITNASNIDDHDFYEEGTTSAPNNINDDIYTQGNVAIGQIAANYKLDIVESSGLRTLNLNNNTTSGPISGIYNTVSGNLTTIDNQIGVNNVLSGTGNNGKIGVLNDITGTGGTHRYGIYNTLSVDNNSIDYGTYSSITSSSISGNRAKYGTYNTINNSGTSDNYGVYNILNGSSTRPQTGIFNWIINSSTSNIFSNYGIHNILQMSGSGAQYGIANDFKDASGSGSKVGVYNSMNSSNNALRYGIDNYIGGSGNGIHVGINNRLQGTGTGNKYGTYSEITPTSGGTHFGLYSLATKPGSFSGFFIGNVAIGTQHYSLPSPNYYILPSTRGTINQIMQTDGTGNVTWQDPSALGIDDHDFYEEGTTTTPNSINDDIYTHGNVAIGKNTADYNLDVIENTSTRTISLDNGSTSGIISGIFNDVSGTMTTADAQRGVYNLIAGSGNNPKFGIYNNINGAGTHNRYGTYNSLSTNSESADYGTYNSITSSSTSSTRLKYGTYNTINNSGTTENYGVYNVLNGTSTSHQYGMHNTIANATNATQYGVRNTLGGTNSTGYQYGIYNEFLNDNNTRQTGTSNIISNNGNGIKTGIHNIVVGDGDDWHIGITNTVGGDGVELKIGIDNDIYGIGTGDKFGSRTIINPTSGGDLFGVYSEALRATGNTFAGFFVGNVAIGTEDFDLTTPNHYVLPASRGTINQIIQTDGIGNLSWVDTSTISSDNQNLTGANLTGTTLQLDIENGTSTSVDLSSLNYWSRTGTNLDVATVGDDINFTSDQTSITFPATNGTPSSMIYMFDSGSSNVDRMVLSHSSAHPGWGLEYEDATDSFIFRNITEERVEIDLLGSFPLRVYGTARAVEFQSDTATYPDYVFESYFEGTSELNKNYTFKSLNEVEAFIKTNGHLPGVASYKEVKENNMSINLAKTSITNLEKIEELFIYAIELKKENDILKEKQKQLEERLKKIETLLLTKG